MRNSNHVLRVYGHIPLLSDSDSIHSDAMKSSDDSLNEDNKSIEIIKLTRKYRREKQNALSKHDYGNYQSARNNV